MRKRHLTNTERTIERVVPSERTDFVSDPTGTQVNHINLKIRHKPIAWGIPLDEVIFAKWFTNFTRLGTMPWDYMITAGSTYLPDARNIIHNNFLTTGLDTLVMLDSDCLPSPDFVDKLMAHKLPIVWGVYSKKAEPFDPVVYDFDHIGENGKWHYRIRHEYGKGLEKVDGVGAGCCLMSRKVALELGESPYDLLTGGEDLVLCQKVQKLGYDVMVDWDCRVAHCGVGYV